MKKFYLFLSLSIIFNLANFLRAQSEIWGVNASGGSGFGTLYGMPTGATSPTASFNFAGNPGSNPQYAKLLEAANGKLYGMTNTGGLNNVGVIFEYDTATNAYTRKIDFISTNGANPKGSLIQAANGKLYGMTQLGGAGNFGVIFEYDIATNTQSVLVSFTGSVGITLGSSPMGSLYQPDPTVTKLYGMTRTGGANNLGVLFEYDYGTGTYTNKVSFTGSTGLSQGALPFGSLIKAVSASSSTTALYGLASAGGTNNIGVLFEYDYANNTYTKKIDFSTTLGSNPQGSLLLASNGRLYGTTVSNGGSTGGVIFDYVISSNTLTKLTDLTIGTGNIGGASQGDLLEATNGKIYGLTRFGGSTNAGVIFEYDIAIPASPVYTKKADFSTANGSLPFGSLIQVSTGKLYGFTSAGGAASGGIIFKYNMSATSYSKTIDLNSSNGGSPSGGLMQASNGKFYGLTPIGGTSNLGTLYEYDRTSNTFLKKVDFTGNTGVNPGNAPYGSLIQVGASKLYGVTSAGGTTGNGTLFSYDIATGTHTKIIDLTGGTGLNQGGQPYGSLALYSSSTSTLNGRLYGITKQGGTSNQGVIFEFDPSTNVYSKKLDLTLASVNGYSAFGSMVQSGNVFYGMTQLGGTSSFGTIFEYDPTTNTYTKKVDFTGTSGAAPGSLPFGSLVETATVGVLYGMTRTGGANDLGVIFEYNVSTNTYSKKVDLSASNGSLPYGSLIKAANGKLYGKTNSGGANGSGVLFEYDIATSTYTKKIDFSVATGNNPTYTQLLEVCTKPLAPGSVVSSTNALCQADAATKNFSIALIPNATSYSWTVPAGGAIISGSTTSSIGADFSGVAAGTFTFAVSGLNVCGSGSLSINTVTVNALPTVSVNSGPVCAGSTFTIIPGGATTYTIEGGSSLVSPSSNTNYTVIGSNALGCRSSNTATCSVVVNSLPIISVNSGTICAGDVFTITPTGVVSSTPSGGSLLVSPTTSTFYTITGTDANNCVSANTATANVNVNILPTIAVTNGTTCAGGNVTITPSGAGAGATYQVGSFTGAGPFVFAPGSSTILPATATTSFGCSSANSPSSTVTVYALPIISVNNPTMCSGTNAVIIPSGAGVSGTYTSGILNGAGPFTVNPSSSTTFTVSGSSAEGCISVASATSAVTVYSLPVVSVANGTSCAGSPYTITPSGAANYTFSGGSTGTGLSLVVSPTSSQSYFVSGVSSNGCISASSATMGVTVFTLPILFVNSGAACEGTTFTLTPSGGTSFTILPMGTTTNSTLVVTVPSSNTSYSVMGENFAGCVASSMAVSNLTVNSLPSISVQNGTICAGTVFNSTVSGAISYTYVTTSPSSTIVASGSTTLSPSSNQQYFVTGSDANGCVSPSQTFSLDVNSLPVVTITGTNAICDGDITNLTASGADTYIWATSTNSIVAVNPSVTTVYTVTGTDLNSCSNTASYTLVVNPLPTITLISGAICPGNSYSFTPGGASTYTFSNGSSVVSPTITTTYSAVGTSSAGCVSLLPAVATVSVVNILTVTVSGNTIVCEGGSVNLTANGASTYSWSTGTLTNSLSTIPSSSTIYTVIGSSGTCHDTTVVNVTVNNLPNVSAVSDRTLICVSESALLTAGGAVNYVWVNNATTSTTTVAPTVATTYTVKGTDANGCEKIASVTVLVSACIGINEVSAHAVNYVLYPNPNAGEFTIETGSSISATIVNALGQIVLEQKLNEGKNNINLNEQAKGIYFVQIKNGSSVKTIKVVKQ
ncbi:hypothetical protein CNR22_16775 [Sphingobacteriaceae bacterium]|nr:hypothetical protein CNR22_16775 [Sphingobacteriaceae bacterium]